MERDYVELATREELADELGAAGEYTADWREADMDDMQRRVVDLLQARENGEVKSIADARKLYDATSLNAHPNNTHPSEHAATSLTYSFITWINVESCRSDETSNGSQ